MLKNKFKYILCVSIALIMLFLAACSPTENKGKYEFDDEGKENKGIVLSDIAEYTVVRGDLCSDEEKKALVTFRETVMKNLGITLPALTDWIGEGQEEREKPPRQKFLQERSIAKVPLTETPATNVKSAEGL